MEEKKLKAVVKPIDMAKGLSEAKSLFKDSFSAPLSKAKDMDRYSLRRSEGY